jgi:outer membrane receptor for ferrienterochelin and colicins
MPAATAGAAAVPVPSVTLVGAQVSRALPRGLTLALGVQNLGDVRLAELSPLFTHVEPPRTWRLTLRGNW